MPCCDSHLMDIWLTELRVCPQPRCMMHKVKRGNNTINAPYFRFSATKCGLLSQRRIAKPSVARHPSAIPRPSGRTTDLLTDMISNLRNLRGPLETNSMTCRCPQIASRCRVREAKRPASALFPLPENPPPEKVNPVTGGVMQPSVGDYLPHNALYTPSLLTLASFTPSSQTVECLKKRQPSSYTGDLRTLVIWDKKATGPS